MNPHNRDWEEYFRTWYEGTYLNGHTWTVYRLRWCEDADQQYLATYVGEVIPKAGGMLRSHPNRRPEKALTLLDPETFGALLRDGACEIPPLGVRAVCGLDGHRRGW